MDNKRRISPEHKRSGVSDDFRSKYSRTVSDSVSRTGARSVQGGAYRRYRSHEAELDSTAKKYKEQQRERESARKQQAEQRKKRLRTKRLRALAALVLLFVIMAVLVLMTPIFNIREIRLLGNSYVTKDVIEEKIGYLIDSNIFSVKKSTIEQQLLEIPKISKVSVKKQMIPPGIRLEISESLPAAYVLSGNAIVVIDSDLKVIDDSGSFEEEKIPSLSGVSIARYKLNEELETDTAEKAEILRTLLMSFEVTGLLKDITYINVDDISAIKFTYDSRIEVNCGSKLELERKIRMFNSTVRSEGLNKNAIGSIDLSVPGKAVYTP